MIEIGKYNHLKILRRTPFGLYLGDESGEDVLLPTKYCPDKYEMGDELKVFVYLDHNEKEIAYSWQLCDKNISFWYDVSEGSESRKPIKLLKKTQ